MGTKRRAGRPTKPCRFGSSSPGVYAIAGMGEVAGAVLGAPISTILIVFELTGSLASARSFTSNCAAAVSICRKAAKWD